VHRALPSSLEPRLIVIIPHVLSLHPIPHIQAVEKDMPELYAKIRPEVR